MWLKTRLKKIEAGRCETRIVYVPDDAGQVERRAIVEKYRHENRLHRNVRILVFDESDRDA